MKKVGAWILEVLKTPEDRTIAARVRQEIAEFARNYPVPGIE